jgi:aspartokinase-like uncharacterized kinase
LAVLAPAAKIVSDLVLFPDYEVTTDSMGLYFANLMGARRYVVISNVDGIYLDGPLTAAEPLSSLTPQELETLRSSKLDSAFPDFFRRYGLPTVVVNGQHPHRVHEAICGRPTVGTRIVRALADPSEAAERNP